ncbi:peptidoglycan -binding protein [Desertibaculum subflavum]|uniref:peptidoglycan -binding protein n=1 Tax=Desertibaculum subflavum TaxID=2268458 RepID=UPI000E66169B
MARGRSIRPASEPWPGYVDVLSTLLLVIVFLLVVFAIAQFVLSQVLSGRDEALARLNQQVAELAEMLSLEKRTTVELRANLAELSATLQQATSARDELALRIDALTRRAEGAEAEARRSEGEIKVQLAEVERLKRDIEALRKVKETLEADVAAKAGEITQLRDRSKELEARLAAEAERTALAQKELEARETRLSELQALYLGKQEEAESQKQLTTEAQAQVAVLNQQILALRQQLARLEQALQVAEVKDKEAQAQIADLGKRLNLALAQKVEELSRYRSEFFGRLREILGDRRDITIVGDRFVFQSEVLFDQGSAELSDGAKEQLRKLARALLEIAGRIPKDVPWILRVDGHTDVIPIRTAQFPSNWELSVARAIAVTRFLEAQGVPSGHLAATGFAEYQPLDSGRDEIAFRRNRRIELRLTDR